MKRLILFAAMLASPVHADAFCAQLDALFKNAVTITPPHGEISSCSTSLALSGKTSKHCAWSFAYRSQRATDAFEGLTKAVQTCLGPKLALKEDQDVNHPDFYDLRSFTTAQGQVGISLKDKGALQETYVFLRVTPVK